jgi:deoxyribodipyrimidine photo-lyase
VTPTTVAPDAGKPDVSICWHRADLRTHDHPALAAAAADGHAVGLVILDDDMLHATSERRRALFYSHVSALRSSYRSRGGELYVRSGRSTDALPAFIAELAPNARVRAVHALRSFTPCGVARDRDVSAAAPLHWHDGLYVHSPGSIRTKQGGAFSVYAPYRAAWLAAPAVDPIDSPLRIPSPEIKSLDPGVIPMAECDVPLPRAGEDAALERMVEFLEMPVDFYAARRDRLDGSGSSRLSVAIAIGALSSRTVVAQARERRGPGPAKWIDELIWRDFLADMLFNRPEMLTEPFHTRWNAFEWNDSEADFTAWRDGSTGVPAVDAAMRELRATGWISNRARMIAAQFLTKHLRVHWTKGVGVFNDWLLDGDVASNTGNWQGAAGLGIDNAPYFRVFNPVSQAKQHDPDGSWLRRWVPESEGRPEVLPGAIVNLAHARREYLDTARAAR